MKRIRDLLITCARGYVLHLCFIVLFLVSLNLLCQDPPPVRVDADRLVMPDLKRIKERGRLIVAQYEGESPPYFFFEKKNQLPENMRFTLPDGKVISGIDIFIAKGIAKILHVKLELKRDYHSFPAVVDAVASGEADLGISNLSVTFERLQTVRFSEPYAVFSFALLVSRNAMLSKGIKLNEKSTGDDFDRYFNRPSCVIGAGKDTAPAEQLFLIFPNATAVSYRNTDELARMVAENRIDAVLGDDFSISFEMMLHPELRLYFDVLNIPNSPEKIAIAVNPESPTLAQIADEVARCTRINSTEELMEQFGPVLKSLVGNKSLEAAGASPVPRANRGLNVIGSFYEKVSGKKVEFSDTAMAAVGVPLAVFIFIWIGMSRRRHHG